MSHGRRYRFPSVRIPNARFSWGELRVQRTTGNAFAIATELGIADFGTVQEWCKSRSAGLQVKNLKRILMRDQDGPCVWTKARETRRIGSAKQFPLGVCVE